MAETARSVGCGARQGPLVSRNIKRDVAGRAPGRGGSVDGRGQPAFEPTDEQREAVAAMVSCGCELTAISRVIGVPLATVKRHFREQILHGREYVHARIARNITQAALQGNVTMSIFFAKTRMGWRERTSVGFEGENGEMMNPQQLFQVEIGGPK